MFKKLKNKIKLKLIKFLQIDDINLELKNINKKIDCLFSCHDKLNNSYKKLYTYYKKIHPHLNECTNKIKAFENTIDNTINVSVDMDLIKHNSSWAVISIEGKTNYLKFVDLRGSNVQEILQFLKRYEGSHRTVDTPMGMSGIFNWKVIDGTLETPLFPVDNEIDKKENKI